MYGNANTKDRACSRKRRFKTQAAGESEARRLTKESRLRIPARVYSCPWCSGWHVTKAASRTREESSESYAKAVTQADWSAS